MNALGHESGQALMEHGHDIQLECKGKGRISGFKCAVLLRRKVYAAICYLRRGFDIYIFHPFIYEVQYEQSD